MNAGRNSSEKVYKWTKMNKNTVWRYIDTQKTWIKVHCPPLYKQKWGWFRTTAVLGPTIREYKTPDVEVLINLLKRDTQLSWNVLHQKTGTQQEMEKAQRIVWSANVLDIVLLGPGSRHVHSTLDTSTKS